MKFSAIRTLLQTNAAQPLLIRTSRTAGYYAVSGVSAFERTGSVLKPTTAALSSKWVLLALKAHSAPGLLSVVPAPSWELPDMAGVMTAGDLDSAVGAAYNDYDLALAPPNWMGRCGNAYRHALMMEAPSGKQAFVLFFEL